MRASIVVPSYAKNSHDLTIESLLQQDFDAFEVLLIKNGCNRNSQYSHDKLQVYETEGVGLDYARNLGVKLSSGDIVAFIDDDALAKPNWVRSIVESHTRFSAHVIGGRVIPIWPSSVKKPDWVKGIFLDYLALLDYSNMPQEVHPLDWLAGTNISFKKSIFDVIGLFDENLELYL